MSEPSVDNSSNIGEMERYYRAVVERWTIHPRRYSNVRAIVQGMGSISLFPGTNAGKWLGAAASVVLGDQDELANDWAMVGRDLFQAMRADQGSFSSDSDNATEQPVQLALW